MRRFSRRGHGRKLLRFFDGHVRHLQSLVDYPPRVLKPPEVLESFDYIAAIYAGAAADGDAVLLYWNYR